MDIYLSIISYKLNEVMKVLTIIATIAIPLTVIPGIYGMNFRYLPETEWAGGYPMVLLIIISIVIIIGILPEKEMAINFKCILL